MDINGSRWKVRGRQQIVVVTGPPGRFYCVRSLSLSLTPPHSPHYFSISLSLSLPLSLSSLSLFLPLSFFPPSSLSSACSCVFVLERKVFTIFFLNNNRLVPFLLEGDGSFAVFVLIIVASSFPESTRATIYVYTMKIWYFQSYAFQ